MGVGGGGKGGGAILKGGNYVCKAYGLMYETIKRDAVFKVENKILSVIIIYFSTKFRCGCE